MICKFSMTKFAATIHDDNPLLDAAFLDGMKPSRRERPKRDAPKRGPYKKQGVKS